MEKLIIRNYGPIESADLTIGLCNVFIGKSSSGKSTAAKLLCVVNSKEILENPEIGTFLKLCEDYNLTHKISKKTSIIYSSPDHYLEITAKGVNSIFPTLPKIKEGDKYLERNQQLRDFFEESKSFAREFYFLIRFSKGKKGLEIKRLNVILAHIDSYLKGKSTSTTRYLNQERPGSLKHDALSRDISRLTSVKNLWSNVKSQYSTFTQNTEKETSDFMFNQMENLRQSLDSFATAFTEYHSFHLRNVYIPAERILISTISKSFFNFKQSKLPIVNVLTNFGADWEFARRGKRVYAIDFMDIEFKHENEKDIVIYKKNLRLDLDTTSSGIQAVVPLKVVIDYFSDTPNKRVLIEEPELNLFPTAQIELINNIVKSVYDPHKVSSLVITTHSPYVLNAINNLAFAFVAGGYDSDQANKLIPKESWINPDHLQAYYFSDGKVLDIKDKNNRLIIAEEIDNASNETSEMLYKLSELI
jgi:hypothetical protein